MNDLVQFIRMAGADSNVPVNEVIPFETNSRRSSIASEYASRSKDRKHLDPRLSKSPYSSKYLTKRNTAAYYKPAHVKNSASLPKSRHHSRRSISEKKESGRKSMDWSVNTQSTKVSCYKALVRWYAVPWSVNGGWFAAWLKRHFDKNWTSQVQNLNLFRIWRGTRNFLMVA